MKNRMLLISLAVVLALSMGLVGCGDGGVPEPTEYGLTISSTEGGSVTTPGQGTGSFSYDGGEMVNLVAEAEEGYRFANWSGDVSSIADLNAASTTVVMDDDYSITANFAYGPAIPLKNPGTFIQMTPADVVSLDPAQTRAWGGYGGEQVEYIYETLVFWDGEEIDQFVPVLATEWELLDDNVTYRFKIREGVKFHEGGDLAPEDVEYSFERAMIQNSGGADMRFPSLLGMDWTREVAFADIDGAVDVDGDWVVFHLCDPAWGLPFLQVICGPGASIVDKEWCIANGEWDGTEETWEDYLDRDASESYLYDHTNGTGPWKLEEWDPGVQTKLVRNDEYWREPAPFERVITQIQEDWNTGKAALLAGDVDCLYTPFAWTTRNRSVLEDYEELDSIADLSVYQDLPVPHVDTFFFNFDIASESEYIGSGELDGNGIPTNFFSDIDVRKGFCYAFDYETFIDDGWLGEAQQVGSPVGEGLPYFNPHASMYSLDLAKAEEHLRTAWAGEVWDKGFKFTVLYEPGGLRRETACKILADNLHAINSKFQISMQPMDWETYQYVEAYSGQTPVFHGGLRFRYPHPDFMVFLFMHTEHWFHRVIGYGYPELDQLIDGAFEELDPEEQEAMYYEIQERYYEDAPGIILCQALERRYFTKYIHGFYYNPMIESQAGPLYYMSKSES